MAESKSRQIYRSRISYVAQHLQATDAGLCLLRKEAKKNSNAGKQLNDLLPAKNYTELNHPVSEETRIINYSRSMNVEFAIIAIYRHFSEYLLSILAEMYHKKPMLVISKAGETLSVTYPNIVNAGSYENLVDEMVNKVFRRLEEMKSMPKMLDKILKGTEVSLTNTIKRDAMIYLEMRHLIIHNNSLCDHKYEKEYGVETCLKKGHKLVRKIETANKAIEAVSRLVEQIDEQLLAKQLLETI